MCIIIAALSERPSDSLVHRAWQQNSDGLGVAWIEGGETRWSKGLRLIDVTEMAQTLPLPFVIHTRLATVGGSAKHLAHPFPVEKMPRLDLSGRAPELLAHNGHISGWRSMLAAVGVSRAKEGAWSDSRAVAHIAGLLSGKSRLRFLRHVADDGNRLALLSGNRLTLLGRWVESDEPGVKLSSPIGFGVVSYERCWPDYKRRLVEPLRSGSDRERLTEASRLSAALAAMEERERGQGVLFEPEQGTDYE